MSCEKSCIITSIPTSSSDLCCSRCGKKVGSVTYGSETTAAKTSCSLGATELQPGDWIAINGYHLPGVYEHHMIYVGNGEFVERTEKGVVLTAAKNFSGRSGYIVHRCGEWAAQRARKRVGETGYFLVGKNCEQLCSEICGKPFKPGQVAVVAGKILAAAVNLANPEQGGWHGSISSGTSFTTGGFSIGYSWSF